MRAAFFESLSELGRRDRRVLLLTADLGFLAIEPFVQACPGQVFNVGVSEQNMVGIATGLAEAGYLPFAYSIAPFAVLRPFEFIRNGPVAHRLPVRIVSVGGGFEYGTCGITHYGLEDVGVLRSQPGLLLVTPADGAQLKTALEALWDLPEPFYLRLSKNDRATVPELSGRFALGHTQCLREGSDVFLVAMGPAIREALEAAKALEADGIQSRVELVDHLNGPLLEGLADRLAAFSTVVTIERHYIANGLGSMVCETVAGNGLGCLVIRCGVDQVPGSRTGSEASMLARFGLSGADLARRVAACLASKTSCSR